MFVTNTPLAQILARQGRWPMSEQDKNWTHQRFQGGWGGPRGLLGWEGGRSMGGGFGRVVERGVQGRGNGGLVVVVGKGTAGRQISLLPPRWRHSYQGRATNN